MSAKGPYDQDLLASAPAATKAQLQEGYATDLLDPNHGRTSSPHLAQPEQSPQADTERGLVSSAKELNGHVSSTKPVPFWRTTKGIIIIVVAIVIVLAAVIGGAVGGTRKKSNAAVSAPSSTAKSTTATATATTPVVEGSQVIASTSLAVAPSASAPIIGTTAGTGHS